MLLDLPTLKHKCFVAGSEFGPVIYYYIPIPGNEDEIENFSKDLEKLDCEEMYLECGDIEEYKIDVLDECSDDGHIKLKGKFNYTEKRDKLLDAEIKKEIFRRLLDKEFDELILEQNTEVPFRRIALKEGWDIFFRMDSNELKELKADLSHCVYQKYLTLDTDEQFEKPEPGEQQRQTFVVEGVFKYHETVEKFRKDEQALAKFVYPYYRDDMVFFMSTIRYDL